MPWSGRPTVVRGPGRPCPGGRGPASGGAPGTAPSGCPSDPRRPARDGGPCRGDAGAAIERPGGSRASPAARPRGRAPLARASRRRAAGGAGSRGPSSRGRRHTGFRDVRGPDRAERADHPRAHLPAGPPHPGAPAAREPCSHRGRPPTAGPRGSRPVLPARDRRPDRGDRGGAAVSVGRRPGRGAVRRCSAGRGGAGRGAPRAAQHVAHRLFVGPRRRPPRAPLPGVPARPAPARARRTSDGPAAPRPCGRRVRGAARRRAFRPVRRPAAAFGHRPAPGHGPPRPGSCCGSRGGARAWAGEGRARRASPDPPRAGGSGGRRGPAPATRVQVPRRAGTGVLRRADRGRGALAGRVPPRRGAEGRDRGRPPCDASGGAAGRARRVRAGACVACPRAASR